MDEMFDFKGPGHHSSLQIGRTQRIYQAFLQTKDEELLRYLKTSTFLEKLKILYPTMSLKLLKIHHNSDVGITVDLLADCRTYNSNVTTRDFFKTLERLAGNYEEVYYNFIFRVDIDETVRVYQALTLFAQLFVAWVFKALKSSSEPCPEVSTCFYGSSSVFDVNGTKSGFSIGALLRYMSNDRIEHSIDERKVMVLLQRVSEM